MATAWQGSRVPASVRELARIVLPVSCPCGVEDVVCCGPCRARWAGPPRRVEAGAGRLDLVDGISPLPVWGLVEYAGPCRELVLAWKDRGRVDLDDVLLPAARSAGVALAGAIVGAETSRADAVAVLPAPSARASTRARGRFPVADLADAFAVGLGCGAAVRGALVRVGGARRQSGLGARDRGRRIAQVAARLRRMRGAGACVLVDDVLTTGATLAACERALAVEGVAVLGAFVLAATPPPDGASGLARPSASGVAGRRRATQEEGRDTQKEGGRPTAFSRVSG